MSLCCAVVECSEALKRLGEEVHSHEDMATMLSSAVALIFDQEVRTTFCCPTIGHYNTVMKLQDDGYHVSARPSAMGSPREGVGCMRSW